MTPFTALLVILSFGLSAIVLLGWLWALLEPAYTRHLARKRLRQNPRMIQGSGR